MRFNPSLPMFALILCAPCFGGAQPDTSRLARHLERFRHYRVYEFSAGEYGPIQDEYIAWVDSRLKTGVSTAQMNEELRRANLLSAGPETVDDMFDRTYAGYLGAVEPVLLRKAGDLLALKIGIHTGGHCNFDETILLYSSKPFRRVGQINAELSYTHGYRLREAAVGAEGQARDSIIGSAWVASNCSSNWNGNIFRIDVSRRQSLQNVLDWDVSAFGGADVGISIEDNTLIFKYVTMLGDPDVLTRNAIARFYVQGGHAVRQAPIAPSFGGFIDEWLTMDDAEAARWGTAETSVRHHDLAARRNTELFTWQGVADCPGPPTMREVVLQWSESKQTTVFLISGANAAEMRMLSVLDTPSSSCHEIDISGDLSSILAEPPIRATGAQ
jgi:hypothetical protein